MWNYEYNIPEIEQFHFERMRAFVETAYRDSLRSNDYVEPVEVVQATFSLDDIPPLFRGKADENGAYVGLAWPGSGRIWVKAGRDTLDMQRTAIHELSHLRVSGQSHGPKWRRVNAVALAMWLHLHTDMKWEDIRREIGRVVYAYRKYRKFTPQGRYNPRSEYLDKCEKEFREIEWAARRVCGL